VFKKVISFFTQELWSIELESLSKIKSFLHRQARILYLLAKSLVEDKCLLRASALTYTTLLSLVPVLAVVFSIAKGFGVQNKLETLLLEKFAMANREVIQNIIQYVNNTDFSTLGALGLIFLIFIAIRMLVNIEQSFNDMWGVKKGRPLFQKLTEYLSVLVISPLLIAAAIGSTASLQSTLLYERLFGSVALHRIFLKMFPFITIWIAFTFIYFFVPNIKVRFKSALIGGIVGGTLWQIVQWWFIHFQMSFSRYNAIYGSFAQIPIFLIWLHLFWVILLLGGEISYAHQNISVFTREIRISSPSQISIQLIGLKMMLTVTRNFYHKDKSWNVGELSKEWQVPAKVINQVASILNKEGLLAEIYKERERYYLPAISPDDIKITQVLSILQNHGDSLKKLEKDAELKVILAKAKEGMNRGLQEITLKDMLEKKYEKI